MKKIIFFIGTLEEGGAQRVVSILANQLINKGFDVEILKYYNTIDFYTLNKRIKSVSVEEKTNTTNKIKNLFWLKKYFSNNADIVISFMAPFNMMALLAKSSVPIIVADRNDPRKLPTKAILRIFRNILYKRANYVVVQTNQNKEYFDKSIQKKCFVISNPINIGGYLGLALKTETENIIVSVGRLMKQKNQLMLINAFNRIKDEFSTYKLIIYGEGEYREVLEQRIKKLNLEDKVLLPGNTKNVFETIKNSKLFVLSSDYEGMPNVLIEAMCLGLPCISTRVSGAIDLIEDGINGKLIDINDENALVNTMIKLLKNDELRNKLARNATVVSIQLTPEIITRKWIELINRL